MTANRFLVTGGAGFIGSHIAQTLAADGAVVRIFDDLSSGKESNLEALSGDVKLVRGDIRDEDAVRAAVAGADVIFHEAAIASVQRSVEDPSGTLDVNVKGTQNVLEAARNAGVRRVVIASSSAVYGDNPALPLRETAETRPLSFYGAHKLMCEHLCAIYTRLHGLETVALRYFNVYGPRQDPNSEYSAVIPRFAARIAAGERPTIFGDGEQTRDFIHVSDVVRANILAATHPRAAGGVFNVGSGDRISLNQIVSVMGELLGVDPNPEYAEPRAGDIRDSSSDISRIRETLGFAPQVSLRQGLAELLGVNG